MVQAILESAQTSKTISLPLWVVDGFACSFSLRRTNCPLQSASFYMLNHGIILTKGFCPGMYWSFSSTTRFVSISFTAIEIKLVTGIGSCVKHSAMRTFFIYSDSVELLSIASQSIASIPSSYSIKITSCALSGCFGRIRKPLLRANIRDIQIYTKSSAFCGAQRQLVRWPTAVERR